MLSTQDNPIRNNLLMPTKEIGNNQERFARSVRKAIARPNAIVEMTFFCCTLPHNYQAILQTICWEKGLDYVENDQSFLVRHFKFMPLVPVLPNNLLSEKICV